MRLHILGICGTFMAGLAALARDLGHAVEGSDRNVYPPMSTQLAALGIAVREGYAAEHLMPSPDLVVVGNAMTRGNPAVEYMLDAGLAYISGPQWLGENVLAGREVLAVAGTHGKTTTSSLLAHLLKQAGQAPGFLIGGVPGNFDTSARLGGAEPLSRRERGRGEGPASFGPSLRGSEPSSGPSGHLLPGGEGESERPAAAAGGWRGSEPSSGPSAEGEGDVERPQAAPFVMEADEYDTAFFDKRSKFVHYRARIAILNNLEYDHADIFPDVAAIERQFHHLVRTIPRSGRLIVNAEDRHLEKVLAMGCWTPVVTFGIARGDWRAELLTADGSRFRVRHGTQDLGEVQWPHLGRHNVMNALAALAAADAAGCDAGGLLPGLATFVNARRRMEALGVIEGIHVYDDFAHHPTAIAATLAGLRARVGDARILVALEPRSNSMRQGAHAAALAPSLADADRVVFVRRAELPWDAARVIDALDGHGQAAASVDQLLTLLGEEARPGDHVVFMSNGGFENAPRRLVEQLRKSNVLSRRS